LWKVISNGEIWHGEICNKAKDGTLFWNEATIVPFLDKDEKIYEYVAIRTDITNQKDLSQKLIHAEKLSAIGELSARIAHDIRNPLSTIRNTLENIRINKDEQFFEKSMKRCDRAIERITHQIDGVMNFLKDSPLELESISLSNLIRSTVSNIVIPDGIKLVLPTNNITILGDKIKLESLFYNLIINAIQSMNNKGTITIRISDESNNMVKIQVEDDGPAIPTDSLKKIFEPLFTTKQSGTGLGLASCKKIVKQHGGTISVSNDPVTFTILLPSSGSTNL
jgi:two-component system sensor histidine kinase HydH